MKAMTSGTAIALILASAAATLGWTGARGQGVPVSNAPPVVAANSSTRIDVTQSGTPIVNIATPRADGTSYNVFSKLNVGKEGLIFNNSKEIGKSQIGGQILANSRLKNSSEASLILNEVTGGTRSDLRGALEVFGGRASLIIANPSGITCDGCGFINVSRAALSTGKITFGAEGAFTGFAVDGGDVRVEGQGLLAGNVDFFDIVTGSAIINANLYARDLVIAGGNADFDYASRAANARAGGNDRLAIDSSLLGGMYANRIRLTGTGTGVGINLQGLVNALEGPLMISADGAITVKSAASASDVSIASKASVNIDDRVYGAGATSINADGDIVLAGDFVGAANAVSLKSGGDIRLGGAGLYAGLSSAGRFDSAGTLTINAVGNVDASGVRAIASEGLALGADSATLSKDSAFSARDISVKIGKSLFSDAIVEATGNLSLSGDNLRIGGGLVANGHLAIDGRSVALSGRAIGLASLRVAAREALGIGADGDLQSAGVASLSGTRVDNAGRVLGMGGALVEAAGALTNSGTILSGGDASINSGGDASLGGTINANGKTKVIALGKASVTGTVAAAGDVALNGASILVDGTLSSGANLSATSGDAFTTGVTSVIVANGAAVLNAKSLQANGYISSGEALDLSITGALALNGQTHAGGAFNAKGTDIALGGVTVSDDNISVTSGGTLSATGAVSAAGTLVANAASITVEQAAQLVAGDALALNAATDITNAGAISGKFVALNAGGALTNTGTLYGAESLDLSAKTVLRQSGTAESGKALSLAADAITLSGKTLGIDGVNARGKTIAATGDLQSGGVLTLEASETLNAAGSILSVGELSATSGADFIQAATITLGKGAKLAAIGSFTQNGTVEAAGSIDLSAHSVSGNGSLSSDASVAIRALSAGINLTGDISAKSGILFGSASAVALGGNVATDGLIDITAIDLSITRDVVASSGFLTRITGGVDIAKAGRLRSGTGLDLSVASFTNRGLIESTAGLSLNTRESLANTGRISGVGAVTLVIGRDLTSGGVIAAGKALTVTVIGDATLDGTVSAVGDTILSASSLVINGAVASGGTLDVTTTNALNIGANGLVSAQKDTKLGAKSLANDGAIVGNVALALSATDALSNSGSIDSGGLLTLRGASLGLGGNITGLGGIEAKADGALVITGALSSDQTTVFDGGSIATAASATIVGAGDISLKSSGAISLGGGLASGAAVSVIGADISTAAGSSQSAKQALTLDSRGGLTLSGASTSDQNTVLRANGDANLLAGSVRAGGAVDLSGANVVIDSRIETNTTAAILAKIGSVRISGSVLAAQDIGVTAQTTLELNGSLQADKTLSLNSGSIGVSGNAVGVEALVAQATGALASTGRLITNGILSLRGGDLNLGGQTQAGGDLALGTGGTLGISGTVFGGKAVTIDASILDLAGTIQSVGALKVTTLTRTGIAANGRLFSGDTLLLNGGRDIASLGIIASSGTGTFNALDSITISNRVDSGATLGFAAQTLTLGGSIASDGGVTATARGALGIDGSLSVKGAVRLDGARVNVAGSVLTKDSARIASLGTLDISGTISADKLIDLSATDLSITKQVTAKTGLAAKATNISVSSDGDLQSGAALSLEATQALTIDGKLLALDALSLSGAASIDVNGTVQSGARAALATDGALAVRGKLTAAGDISVTAANAALGGTLSSGGALGVNAGDVTVTGRLAANTAIDITAAGAATLASGSTLESDGSIALKGATVVANGTLLSGRTALLDAATALDQTGRVEARDGVTFSSRGALSSSGTVLTLGSVTVTGGATDLAGDIGAKTLLVNAAALRVRGKLSAGQTLDLIAANALTTDATAALASGAAFGISAGTTATLGGTIDAGGALNVRAGDALTLSAVAKSGEAASLRGRVITLDGSLAADKILSVDATDALNINGALSGVEGLSARGGTVDVGALATLRTNQALSLTSDSRITNAGDISALGAVSVSAGAALENRSSVSGAALSLEGGDVTLGTASKLAATGALSVVSRDSLSSAGTIDTNDTLSLSARGAFDQSATIRAAKATAITAIGALTNSASINTADTLTLTAASITGSGAITANGQANLTSTVGDISLGGAVASATGIMVDSARDVSLLSTAITDGALTLRGRDISLSGLAIGRDSVAINAARAVQLFGNATLSSNGQTRIDGVTLTNDGVISANDAVNAQLSGSIVNRKDILTDGRLTLNGADISSSGALRSGAALDLDGSGTVVLGGSVTAGTTLDVASGQLVVDGAVNAKQALALGSRGAIALGSSSTLVTDSNLSVRSDGTLLAAGTSFSGGTTLLRGTNGLAASNNVQSVGDVTLDGGALTLDGTLSTDGTLTATTLGSANLTGRYSGAKGITINSGATDFAAGSSLVSGEFLDVTADSLNSAGALSATKTLSLKSNADLLSSGTISAGGALTLDAVGALTQRGTLESAGVLTLKGSAITLTNRAVGVQGISVEGASIDLTSSADLQSDAGLTVTSRGAITTAGTLNAGGDLSLTASTSLTQAARVFSDGAVTLDGGGTLANSGDIDAALAIMLRGNNLFNSAKLASEQSIAITNRSGTASLGGTVSGKAGVSLTSTGDVAVSGIVASGTTLGGRVTGTLSTTVNGELRAKNAIDLVATTAISNAGLISSGDALNFTTPAFSSVGTLESGKAFALSAGSITLAGRVASTDSITLNATSGALDLGATLQATDVTLSSLGGDLTVRSGINVDATGLASLTSNRGITIGGIVTGNRGVTVATTGGAINFARGAGARSAAEDVSVSASGSVANAGTLTAKNDINVSGSVISSGAISADGAVTLNASGAINVNDIIDSGTIASLTSSSGAINVATLSGVLSGGSIILSAAGDITNDGDLSAETTLDSTSGAALSNSSTGFIFSKLGRTLLGGARLSLGGDIYSGTTLALNSNDIVIGGSVGANDAFGLTTNSLNILQGGLLQSNNALTLALGTTQIDGTLRALDTLDLTALSFGTGLLGQVEAAGRLNANVTGVLDNRGTIAVASEGGTAGTLTLAAGTLNNSNAISATGNASLSGGALSNSGTIESGANLSIANSAIEVEATGRLEAVDALTVNSATVNSAGTTAAGGALSVTGRDALDLTGTVFSNSSSVALASDGLAKIASNINAKTSVSIIGGTVQLAGDVVADGDVQISANSGALDITSNIDSGTAITLTANSGNLSVGAGKSLFGTTGITANARGIDVAANLIAPGAITLNAQNALTVSANLVSNAAVNLSAGGSLLLGGNVDALSASLTAATLTTRGTIDTSGAVALNVGSAASIESRISAGGAISFTSGGRADLDVLNTGRLISDSSINFQNVRTLSVAGLVSAANGVDVATSGNTSVAGRIEGRDISLTANSGATTTISGVVEARGALTLSGGTLDLAGRLASGGALSVVNDATTVTTTGAALAGGTLTLDGAQLSNTGTLGAIGNVTLGGTNALSSSGTIFSNTGSISLTSNGTATIDGFVDAATSVSVTGASVALGADIDAGGAVGITATTGALGITSNINSGNAITLTANNGDLSIGAGKTLFGATGVTAGARGIDVAADLIAPGAITLDTQNALTVSGNLLSNAAVNLTAGTSLLLGGNIDALSASLTAATLTTRGTIDTSGAVALNVGTAASIENRISAGTISFISGGRANLDVTATGKLISGNSVDLQNVAAFSVAGEIAALNGDVVANFTGVANILGRVTAKNDVRLSNVGGGALNIASGGVVAAGNDIVITGGTLNVAGLAYAGRDFSFSTGVYDGGFNSLTVDGTLAAGRNIGITTAGGLRVGTGGLIAADGNINFSNAFVNIAGSVAAGTALTNGTLTIITRGDLGLPGADFTLTGSLQSVGAISVTSANGIEVLGGRFISDSSVALSGPSITALGTIGAADLVSISSTGNIFHGGLIQSGRRIAVSADGSITLQSNSRIETVGNATSINFARDAGAAANIDVRAGGAISASGIFVSDGAIALRSASSDITNSGTITGVNDVVLQADSGAIINNGAITGTNLAVYQGVDFLNTGSFTAAGNLLLSAPSITNSGLLGSSGSLILFTPGALINQAGGTIFAGGSLAIEAGGGIVNDLSTILAVGNIGLTAPSLLNNSARVESLGGSISLQALTVVNQIKNLSITPGGVASPAGLYGSDNMLLSGTQGFDITTCSGGGGFLYRCSGNNVEVRISTNGIVIGTFTYRPATVGGDDSVTTNSGSSQIIAARDVTITTGSNALGTVTNSNSSILAGNNISITASTLNNIATLLNRSIMRDIIEVRRQRFVEDANVPCPATAIPGTCMTNVPPTFFTTWEEFVNVVVGTEQVVVQDPLPTLINAGGTVALDVGTLNNNQPVLNGQTVNGSGGGTPGVTTTGANPAGGRGGFVDPNAGRNGVTGALTAADIARGTANALGAAIAVQRLGATTGADAASGGRGAQATGLAVDVNGGGLLTNSNSTGDGAGTIGTATAATVGVGGALLNANGATAANSGGTTGANGTSQRGASVGVTLADGSAGTGAAGTANGGGANGAGATNLTAPGAVSVNGTNANGGAGVGTGIGTPGGFVNSLINRISGGGGAGVNGAGVGGAGLVNTVGVDGANLPGSVQTAAIVGVDAVDPNTVTGADLTGTAAQSARLVDGFGGLAIPNILGTGGQAGGFVLDFLRSFGLTANGGGFGLAGGGGLFTFNNNPDSQFLFTTNPGFGSLGDLFDSSFFFAQLGIDKATRFTRLGDGFFEAQLIGKQVQAATGQAQLGAFGDAFAQARGLLQAGVAEAARLKLSVGVALTAAQVASLKSSLVWYVKSTVAGREVLVPVVYLAAADQKSIKNGAVISGTNVVANVTGSITNNGTISASRVVSLTAGGDIVNQAGGRIAGGTIIASAARDILAQGGSSISGDNILLSAGRDISLTATTATTSTSARTDLGKPVPSRVEGGRFTQSSSSAQTVTGAEIAATGALALSAGRDLTLSAAKVSAGGDASLSAGRDVTITGVTTTDTTAASSRTGKKNSTSATTATQTFNGTTLTSGGNLTVAAGNALIIKGSDIASGGSATLTGVNGVQLTSALENSSATSSSTAKRKSSSIAETASTNRLTTITAGGNLGVGSSAGHVTIAGADLSAGGTTTLVGQSVSISGVIDSASFDATSRTVKGGLLSKKVTTTTSSSTSQAVVASTVSGDRVNVVATNGDVKILGANVVSDNLVLSGVEGGTLVQATGAITIGTLEAKSSESHSVKIKKSGISISGAGLFAGVAKSTNASTLETTTNTGSLVGSANGNVTVNSGKALTITASQIAAPGQVNLIGESVTIQNATDTANSTSLSKSSSFGVSIKAQSNVVDAVKTVSRLGEIGTTTSNARVAAVSAVAGGLAVANGIDAAKDVAKSIKDGAGSLGVTVSASIGFSKSKSTSASTDQTIIASSVSGGDVNIIASGAASAGTVKVIGSDVSATNNLTVLGNGPITFQSATETDTSSGKSSSFGVSLGVSAGVGLGKDAVTGKSSVGLQAPSVNFGISGSKSSFSGTDVTNREATLSAGGTATVGTPGALTLDGGVLSAKRVEIDAGSLSIASRQDTSTFASKDKSAGVNVSVTFAGQVSASGNLSSGKQSGDFASVQTQAGIRAGEGGFGIRVAGATDLKGAVIASTADAARNQLTTGTLTASDIANRETFKATSTSLGAGLGNIGQSRTGQTTTDGTGNKPAGLATPLGNLSATPPAALSASGSQASTTVSAIAQGGITVTSGDTASLGVAQSISRDTSSASEALTKQFTETKRTEINQGFEATRQLVSEVGTFFANRGREEADLRKAADEAKARGDTTEETRLRAEAKKVGDTFGSGSAIRIAATAFTAAAGSNVTGGLGSFAQAAAVNVIQSLAASKVKDIADNIQGDRQTQESVRAALQAVVGCAGSVAGGNGGCGDAAIGAAASVVINNLITSASITPRDTNGDGVIDPLSAQEQQARVNLVTTLIAALATGAGLDAQIATTAATIETENNKTRNFRLANGAVARIADGPGEGLSVQQIIAKFGIDKHPDLSAISKAYGTRDPDELQAIVNLIASGKSGTEIIAARSAANEAFGKDTPQARAAFLDIGNGRTTTAEVQARAEANRIVVSSGSGGFNQQPYAYRIDLVAHLQAVKLNYDATYGAGAYDALIAQGRAEDAATQARVNAALAQADREFACLALCIPGAVASVIFFPIAVEAAGTYATSATGLAGTSALLVKGGIGGTASLAYTEASSQALFGHAPSTGERIGSFTTGAIFAPGVFGVSQFSAPVNGAINGGASGFLANGGGQAIDFGLGTRDRFSLPQLVTSTAVGSIAGGVGGTVQPYFGRTPSLGNSQSIVAGARVGVRVQANAAPQTIVTTVTQAHVDPVANVALCTAAPKDCPK